MVLCETESRRIKKRGEVSVQKSFLKKRIAGKERTSEKEEDK